MGINTACPHRCINGKVFLEALNAYSPCPIHGSVDRALVLKNSKGEDFYDRLMIPENYRKCGLVGKEILMEGQVHNLFSAHSLDEVGKLLENYNRDIYNGAVPKLSAYVYISQLVDIRQWVYGLQKLALDKEISVVPYMSLNSLAGVCKMRDFTNVDLAYMRKEGKNLSSSMISAIEGWQIANTTGLTYFDFCDADLCILEATAMTTETGWTALGDLLAERARYNKATLVMGYWATKTTKATGLTYLLNNGNLKRLDKLSVFEFTSKRDSGNEVSASSKVDTLMTETLKPTATAGIVLTDIL